MRWQPNSSLMLMVRSLGRRLGINRWVATRFRQGNSYEAKYDNRISKLIRTGDCVWDIGANIGYYTQAFSDRVGPKGIVYAFEPSPKNYTRLVDRCAQLENSKPIRCALGSRDGEVMSFVQGVDDLGATSHITSRKSRETVEVTVRTASGVVLENIARPPNVVKIDVEGFEREVLEGMSSLLHNSSLRAIGIEVHFGILSSRGMGRAPKDIEHMLRRLDFQIEWPDMSHLVAFRVTDSKAAS